MATKSTNNTRTTSYTNNGMTTTSTYDENGRLLNRETKPYEQTSYVRDDGATVVKESPIGTTVFKPTTKETTATTKDGKSYTFEGDNWINYANANGLDPNSLATAISYPSYVDAKEANRFLNEQADRYGVNLSNPLGAYEEAVTKDYAIQNNLIPDYNTPFASAAAGQTETNYDFGALNNQNYYNSMNNMTTQLPLMTGTNNSNINNIVSNLGGNNLGGYQGFDYKTYFDDATKSYRDSVEAQRAASQAQYDAAKETALENANADALISPSTLSQLIYAQNFSMPAGYITKLTKWGF